MSQTIRLQKRAAALCVEGRDMASIAAELGIRPSTLLRWQGDARYLQEMERLRRQRHQHLLSQVVAAHEEGVRAALKTLQQEMNRLHSLVDAKRVHVAMNIIQVIEKQDFMLEYVGAKRHKTVSKQPQTAVNSPETAAKNSETASKN